MLLSDYQSKQIIEDMRGYLNYLCTHPDWRVNGKMTNDVFSMVFGYKLALNRIEQALGMPETKIDWSTIPRED